VTTIRALLIGVCLAGLLGAITVQGEIDILDRRIAVLELAAKP
jgi:hypothetical protein